jgi:TonB-linked SusC/RagA family outer membrane protein
MKNILTNIIKYFLIILLCPISLVAYGQEKIENLISSETDGFSEKPNPGSKLIQVGNGQVLKKNELTSSVGFISRDILEKITAHDVGSMLFGQIQGLRVFQNAGYFPDDRIPGLNIRGQATTQDKSILILIDGVERPLNTVLPEEIESISVLRDAAAKARYGQRGANGVLLLTTKRGNKSNIRFVASMEHGVSQPTRLPKFLDAASYAKAENEARQNEGLNPRYSETEIRYFQSGQYPFLYPNVNWLNEILANNAYFSRYNFGFSGGNDITNYFVSLNYQNDNGLYKHTNLNDDYSTQLRNDKINMRTNLDIILTPTTLVQVNLGGFISINRQPATPGAGQSNAEYVMFNEQQYSITRLTSRDIVQDAFSIPSALFPVRNEDGSWGGTNQFGNNPVAQISDVGFDKNHVRSFFNEVRIKQDLNFIIDGLSIDVFGAYYNQADYWENKTKTFEYKEVIPKFDISGNITGVDTRNLGQKTDLTAVRYSGNQQRSSFDFRTELAYNKISGEHAINAWALYHQNQYDMHVTNQVYRYRNFAGNIHYGFAGKYFLDGTLSYSGTNRIQKRKDRFGLFPAIAGAWMISKEAFMENAGFLNILKIRASYGKTGNGLIQTRDLTSDKYGGGYSYNFGTTHEGAGGTREIELGIAHKKFETSLESNIGIDARLFNKLDATGELFFVKRKNIFVPADGQYSTVLGLLPSMLPEGEVQNKGYELEITWSEQIGDFNYHIGGMFSHYKNKIVNINEEFRPHDYMKRTGHAIGQYFGWKSEGFFRDEADIASHPKQLFGNVKPGDIVYSDLNGDDYIDEYDQTTIGYSSFPEIYYSFSVGFGWKRLELSALFQGTGNSSAYLSQSHVFWPLQGDDNISTWYKNYWSPSNRERVELPRLAKQSDNNYRSNDIWIRNKSFLKLRYTELSYTFPKNLITNIGLQKLKVYLRTRDLFSIDDIKYVDPEGTENSYPSLKNYNIGVTVNF